jgi:hypothetical protein
VAQNNSFLLERMRLQLRKESLFRRLNEDWLGDSHQVRTLGANRATCD